MVKRTSKHWKRSAEMKSIGQLEGEAQKLIKEQGSFLLVYDIISSRKYNEIYGWRKTLSELKKFNNDINKRFKEYLSEGQISPTRRFTGFNIIISDNGGGFLNSHEAISKIVKHGEKVLPFDLRWAVGKDGWDERIKI